MKLHRAFRRLNDFNYSTAEREMERHGWERGNIAHKEEEEGKMRREREKILLIDTFFFNQ